MNKINIILGILLLLSVMWSIGAMLAENKEEELTRVILSNIYLASFWIILALS